MNDTIYKKIGDTLKEYRISNDLSQEKMADLFGITQSQYSKIENGLKGSGLDKLSNIISFAKKLDMPEDVLMGFSQHTAKCLNEKDKLYITDIKQYIFLVDFDRIYYRKDFLGDVKRVDLYVGAEFLNIDKLAIVTYLEQYQSSDFIKIKFYLTPDYEEIHKFHLLDESTYLKKTSPDPNYAYKKVLDTEEKIEAEVIRNCEGLAYRNWSTEDEWENVFRSLFANDSDINGKHRYLYVRERYWAWAYSYLINPDCPENSCSISNLLKLTHHKSLTPLIKDAFKEYKKTYIDHQDLNNIFQLTDENFIMFFKDKYLLFDDNEHDTIKDAVRAVIKLPRISDEEKEALRKEVEDYRKKPMSERFIFDIEAMMNDNDENLNEPVESDSWI